MNYKTKCKPVKAIQWTGDNLEEVKKFIKEVLGHTGKFMGINGDQMSISVPLGKEVFRPGRWICRINNGVNEVMSDEEFNDRFEKDTDDFPKEFITPKCLKCEIEKPREEYKIVGNYKDIGIQRSPVCKDCCDKHFKNYLDYVAFLRPHGY